MLITPWHGELVSGVLLRRRHRFIADVSLPDGRVVESYCANPGRMEGLVVPGAKIWLSRTSVSKRRMLWNWELVCVEQRIVGANSLSANFLVRCLLETRELSGFKRYRTLRQEYQASQDSRIDFAMDERNRMHLIEVKNANLIYPDGIAYFPDAKTIRSIKHLAALERRMKMGDRASLFFAILSSIATKFRPSDFHDPGFASALRQAAQRGLSVRALRFEPTLKGYIFRGEIPVDLRSYSLDRVAAWHLSAKECSGWERPKGEPTALWRKPKT